MGPEPGQGPGKIKDPTEACSPVVGNGRRTESVLGPPRDPVTRPGNQSTCVKRHQRDKQRPEPAEVVAERTGAPGRCSPEGGDPSEDKARQTRNTSSRWPDGLAQLQRPLGKLVQAKGKRDTPTGSALGEGRAGYRQSPRTPADAPRGPRGGGVGRGGVDVATEREAGAPSRHPVGAGRGHRAPRLAVFYRAAAPSAGQGGAGEEGPASPVPGREEAGLSSDCAAPRKGTLVFQSYFQKRLEADVEAPSKHEGGKHSGSCDFEWEPGGRGARAGAQSHTGMRAWAQSSPLPAIFSPSAVPGATQGREGGTEVEIVSCRVCVCVCVCVFVCVCERERWYVCVCIPVCMWTTGGGPSPLSPPLYYSRLPHSLMSS